LPIGEDLHRAAVFREEKMNVTRKLTAFGLAAFRQMAKAG
jgi:hypothetical protein